MSSSNLTKASKNQCKSAHDLTRVISEGGEQTDASKLSNHLAPPNQADPTATNAQPVSPKAGHKPFSLNKIKADIKSIFKPNWYKNSDANFRTSADASHSDDANNSNDERRNSSTLIELVAAEANNRKQNKHHHGHTVGVTSGARILGMMEPESSTEPPTRPNTLESDHHRRNFGSNGNFFLAFNDTGHSNTTCNNQPTGVNFNPKAAAINLKIIPSSQPANYHIDADMLEELRRKLAFISDEERIELQKLSLGLLCERFELRKSEAVSLEEDIKELKSILFTKNEGIRSQFEIDNLKNEIRNLTNEKAELEIMISRRSDWNCSKCTFKNKNEDVSCNICGNERDVIYICKLCNTKNSIINQKCTKCSASLGAEHHQNQPSISACNGADYQSPTHPYNSQISSTSTGSAGSASSLSNNYQPHPYCQQQSSNGSGGSGGGVRSRNASSTSLNNQIDSPNSAHPPRTHRPPPPVPPRPHQNLSAPVLPVQPSYPFVPGVGLITPPVTAPPNQPSGIPLSVVPNGNRSPLIYHNNSHSSPTFRR